MNTFFHQKKAVFLLLLLAAGSIFSHVTAQTHDRFANFARYQSANQAVGLPAEGEKRVVLMGNSITDSWPKTRPEFFAAHPYLIGRGISGQTSYQFLLRFRQDVVDLHPTIVVINYGTNDIAINTGPYDEDKTFGNVLSMVDIARANGIRVVLASCLPAAGFRWRPEVTDAMEKVRSLNARVRAYAEKEGIPYIDYFSALVSADGTQMRAEYAKDQPAIHPNAAGYQVMEALLLKAIE